MKNANGVIKKLTSAERSYYTAAEVREPVRSIFAYDRYCRRKRHQEDQSCNGSASDHWHSDCKYPGNYSDTSVFVLWHTEGVNIT